MNQTISKYTFNAMYIKHFLQSFVVLVSLHITNFSYSLALTAYGNLTVGQ